MKNDRVNLASRVSHPGILLAEELEARKLTQAEFSSIIDRPARTVNEIINEKRSITPETAEIIAAALGTSPDMWLALQAEYDLFVLDKKRENKVDEVRERSELYDLFPFSDLVRREYISGSKNVAELKKQIKDLLGLNSIDEFSSLGGASMRVGNGDIISSYVQTWVLLGKKIASSMDNVGDYKKDALVEFAKEIKDYSRKEEDGIKEVLEKLLEIGVRVVVLPHFTKTRADGAACWLEQNKPVILLSLRYDRIDNFYFTLLHEIGHILLHPNSSVPLVDVDIYSAKTDEKEIEANEFALEMLGFKNISSELEAIDLSPLSIKKKSREIGVHPGLLIGHLQHERILDYSKYRKALIRVGGAIPKEISQN